MKPFKRNAAGSRRGFSAIELLMVAGIVIVLTGIALVAYQGSLDRADLKIAMPRVAELMNECRHMAERDGKIFEAEFIEGSSLIAIKAREAADAEEIDRFDVGEEMLLERPLVFGEYAWPDGAAEPRTFTFFPDGNVEGGEVEFGSAYAAALLRVRGDRVDWVMKN